MGLVARWTFQSGISSVIPPAYGNITGYIANGRTFNQLAVSGVNPTGALSSGIGFNGAPFTGDYMSFSGLNGLLRNCTGFSAVCWAQLPNTAPASGHTLFYISRGDNPSGYRLQIDFGNASGPDTVVTNFNIEDTIRNTGVGKPYQFPGQVVNNWHQLTITVNYNNNEVRTYRSGVFANVNSGDIFSTSTDNTDPLIFEAGRKPFNILGIPFSYSSVRLADLRIYDHVLSSGEIFNINNASGTDTPASGLTQNIAMSDFALTSSSASLRTTGYYLLDGSLTRSASIFGLLVDFVALLNEGTIASANGDVEGNQKLGDRTFKNSLGTVSEDLTVDANYPSHDGDFNGINRVPISEISGVYRNRFAENELVAGNTFVINSNAGSINGQQSINRKTINYGRRAVSSNNDVINSNLPTGYNISRFNNYNYYPYP